MKLNIPPIGQKDSRWASKRLGTSDVTVGKYGCLLVCHTMFLNYLGHDVTPDTLNVIYKEKGVFDQGNLINFWAAANVFGNFDAGEYYQCLDTPCDLSKIDDMLAKKLPIIAMVDFSPDVGVQTHFVLIIGKAEDGAYFINDPWTGETYYFHAKYGDPVKYIYGLRSYLGTPKDGESIEDQVNDLTAKLKSCNEAVADKSLETNTLRDALQEQERDNKDLAQQLLDARSERDKAVWEKERFEAENKKLAEEVEKLKKEIGALKIRIKDLQKSSIMSLSRWELLKFTLIRLLYADETKKADEAYKRMTGGDK